MGKIVGQFVPDTILAFLTAGAGTVAKSSLTALKVSEKLAAVIIKFKKFVGRNIKILNGKYQFLLKKVSSGIGITGREVVEIVKRMSDFEFLVIDELTQKSFWFEM